MKEKNELQDLIGLGNDSIRKNYYRELQEKIEELEKTRNFISNIVNSMPSVIIGVDSEGKVTQWNQNAEKITGVSSKDAIGKEIIEVFPTIESKRNQINECISQRKVFSEIRQSFPEGNEKPLYEDITIYPLIANGITGAVLRIDDVTHEHTVELQVAHSRKMEAIGQLAGGIAHDFNNMLCGITGAAEILKLTIPWDTMDKEDRDCMDIILSSSKRAGNLISRLLSFAGKNSNVFSLIDVHKIISDTIHILEHTIDKCIETEFSLKAEDSQILGDYTQLQNIFLNMGINSGYAMPDGGKLSFSCKNVELNENYCSSSAFSLNPGRYLEIEIRDNGCGIPAENLHRIFEPFYSTRAKGKGSGLGLSTVYTIIREHKGEINVFSKENSGTVFQLLLPLSEDNSQREICQETLIFGNGTLLLVDDEKSIRVTASQMLKSMNYNVICAENGKQAVEIYQEMHGKIDGIILDMVMPVMGGAEALREIRKINPQARVLVASGYTKREDLEEIWNQGNCSYLEKPFRKIDLSKAIAKLLQTNPKANLK